MMPRTPARTSQNLAALCAADGEFRIASRHWTGGLRLAFGTEAASVTLAQGIVTADDPGKEAPGVLTLSAAPEVWDLLLAAKPPRFHTDISTLIVSGRMTLDGDRVLYAQYYPAVMRAIELLRSAAEAPAAPARTSQEAFDSPTGRYVHLTLEGQDHRVYFEEAGRGIPLLLQHTAGCHASQWRHLFECPDITDHFRLIAYDLPYHGKSLPPVGPKWWANEYSLTGSFLRSVPLALASALQLDRPVFMGCSVGGLLALDLARRHSDIFRAVISVEGALKIEGDPKALALLWHPQVSNDYKARLMNGLMSPVSPEALRKETSFVYASGWPPAFIGDLFYYITDYDLRRDAAAIDTEQVGVHILSGEYDTSGTQELGQAAHEAIAGSTWRAMKDVGHFPMSENPDAFISYLMPVLDSIRRGQGARQQRTAS
jgi:pimeloyl-ACP methyl ester carboxylesterase